MSDVFFVIKALVVTILIVIFMQIKIGGSTIERHSVAWIHQSAIIDNLRMVAEGAVKAAGKGYDAVHAAFEGDSAKSSKSRASRGDEFE